MTYGADGLLNDVKGFYVRKRSDDRDVNAIARYVYDEKSGGFTRSASPEDVADFSASFSNRSRDLLVLQLQEVY